MKWTGLGCTVLTALVMTMSAAMKLMPQSAEMTSQVALFGYPTGTMPVIGIVELACMLLYVVPRTSVLGAILLTGYLGGAVATHVRISDPAFFSPVVIGVVAWAGLYLREERLRLLLPLRSA